MDESTLNLLARSPTIGRVKKLNGIQEVELSDRERQH